jgi:hypothetical protein
MHAFLCHSIHRRCLQTLDFVHKAHGIVPVIIRKNEDDVHGLLRMRYLAGEQPQ